MLINERKFEGVMEISILKAFNSPSLFKMRRKCHCRLPLCTRCSIIKIVPHNKMIFGTYEREIWCCHVTGDLHSHGTPIDMVTMRLNKQPCEHGAKRNHGTPYALLIGKRAPLEILMCMVRWPSRFVSGL
ncbi:uncharacterized protein LOC107304430 isoform X2 [Oryza brachyantha]|uniref:uncharacterized protein LOC107304430 isoform X2 n=1 Tax=Oryza brachyantha TaxID=4533 RepID=UPI000776ABCA|nr:uncharacterized protein LOC107304430 isoform X2 [Oryza brachyantha]